MIEWACCGVILQHIPYIFFCESCHFIELWIQRVIGADVESAAEVVHRHGAYAGDETTLDAGIGSGFEFNEKSA